MLVLVELFGSPMMKNCNVIIALLFGYFVAGVSEKCVGSVCKKFVVDTKIEAAEDITFLWAKTFKLGFYGPAVFLAHRLPRDHPRDHWRHRCRLRRL